MPTLQDLQRTAFDAQGFTSKDLPSAWMEWAIVNGATSNDLNEAIIQALRSKGITTATQSNDAWKDYLDFLGYSGTLPDQMKRFWEDGGLGIIANDTFTDIDNTDLSAHASDSGHSWSSVNGVIEIINNEADIITALGGWNHYALDLSGEVVQPSEILIEVKNTDLVIQSTGISLRDNIDDLNFIYCTIVASLANITLNINSYVAGAETAKASLTIPGDFRNSTDFFPIKIIDTGSTITIDATSIQSSAILSWNTAPAPLYKSIGFYQQSSSIVDSLFDNLVIRG